MSKTGFVCFLLLASTLSAGANGRGGSNYAWYSTTGCSPDRDVTGVIGNYHVAKSTIDSQLSAMVAGYTQTRLRLPILYEHGAPTSQNLTVDSSSCNANGCSNPSPSLQQYLTNFTNLLATIKAIPNGYSEVEVAFFPIGVSDPHNWQTYNTTYFNEHLGLIQAIRSILDSSGLLYRLDLLNEGLPLSTETQLLLYDQHLWTSYTALFGVVNAVGVSINADRVSSTDDRMSHLAAVYNGVYPYLYDVHLYADATNNFVHVRNAFQALRIGPGVGWIIGEAYYNDAQEASEINAAQTQTGQVLHYLTQYPLARADAGTGCGTTGNPPTSFSNYINAGF